MIFLRNEFLVAKLVTTAREGFQEQALSGNARILEAPVLDS